MRPSKSWRISALALVGLILPPAVQGQEVVELPGRDRALRMDQEAVYSVGSMAGEDWETFASIVGLAFDGQGNLYILDRSNFRVVKVGPRGEFLGEMGRSGGGPGEFGMPMAFSVTRSGEVRVFDMGQQGFTLFNPDGTFMGTARLSTPGMFIPNGALLSLPNGEMVDGGGSQAQMMVVGGADDSAGPRPVHRFTMGEEAEVSTAYEGWNPLMAAGTQREEVLSGGGFQIQAPPLRAFDPGLFVGVLPDGMLAVADTTTYTVKLVDPERGVTRTLTRPFEPREVTRRDEGAERDRRLAEITEREEASSGSGRGARVLSSDGGGGGTITVGSGQVSDLLRARVEGMEFGPEIPVIERMVVDWDGRIWVERTGRRVGEDGPTDLIDAAGNYLGTLQPGELEIPAAFGPGGLAAWVETDELDVPVVVVKRLTIR